MDGVADVDDDDDDEANGDLLLPVGVINPWDGSPS
jgi:hypothetical protein